MPAIRKILLPTDFSPCAEPAVNMGIDLARAFQAQLLLLYVYNAPLYLGPLGESYMVPATLVESLRRDAERALAQLRQRADAAGVSAETLAAEGLATDVIVEVARSQGVDLIVMGTHGRTGFRHFMLGSVAERVVRSAPCPVLTVRTKAEQPERA